LSSLPPLSPRAPPSPDDARGIAVGRHDGCAVRGRADRTGAVQCTARRPGVQGPGVRRSGGTPYAMRRRPLRSPLGLRCNPPPWGQLAAIDAATGSPSSPREATGRSAPHAAITGWPSPSRSDPAAPQR
jgi:hypothetical protein